MTVPSFIILYVDNPAASAAFYRDLLDVAPVEASPSFVLFVLPPDLKLGLWARHGVEPKPAAAGGGAELGFAVESAAAVDATHDAWRRRGLAVVQPPTAMDFGRTFVALDPDGHRLRVFCPMA